MMLLKPPYKTGLVLGKFMPMHKGHEYLIRFAQQYCEHLTVVVDCLEGQTISPELRKAWVEEQCPGVHVVALTTPMPQQPEDTPRFWEIWRDTLYQAVGGRPDVLVANMDYGWALAEALACDFVPGDIARETFPISATAIRENPLANWDFIAESARSYFLKKVCLMGPESTGKSTAAIMAARALNTVFVSEYAKAVIERQQGQFFEHNVKEVAIGQHRSENALAKAASRVLVCDTNMLTTLIWSDVLFGRHPQELEDAVLTSNYDLTLLFSPDVPWVADVHRDVLPDGANEQVRWKFFDTCRLWLDRLGWRYSIVEGAFDIRGESVVTACKELIAEPLRLPT
jgi:NadR type nicotinamide-nucleotide adenylyltransferase